MPRKKAQNQWDFGELFEEQETRKVHSVTELTTRIKSLLNKEIGETWVSGEITNFRAQSSGHCYFSLKDAKAQLSCVLFRGQRVENREALDDGQKVQLRGDLTVYEARGQYQLIVSEIELQGVGALQLKFEKLKRKLEAEGLFDPERKRELPEYPARIGLITSPTGAAIRDVIHVIERRNPALEIIHASARVQGDGAAREIARAVADLNTYSQRIESLDLILVTRGGGSLEDLWAFNEEVLARAIADSAVPIVSAVGHEIDFTISDFVSDLRAATPSAAAEIITEGVFASRQFVAEAPTRMRTALLDAIADRTDDLDALHHRMNLQHPRRRLAEHFQRLDDLQDDLKSVAASALRDRRTQLEHLAHRIHTTPLSHRIAIKRQQIRELRTRIASVAQERLTQEANRLSELEHALRLLAPQNILDRGYSITRDTKTGAILKNAKDLSSNQQVTTILSDGEFTSHAD